MLNDSLSAGKNSLEITTQNLIKKKKNNSSKGERGGKKKLSTTSWKKATINGA